jgi:oligopeptide/dipeptide ABC transporter ATP-binding protein
VRLRTIEGMVPDLRDLPPGCRFADRCPMVVDACTKSEPELVPVPGADAATEGTEAPMALHLARCIRAADV